MTAVRSWGVTGEIVRAAATLHSEDDDFGQPGEMYRRVLDDAAKARLVSNISGHLKQDVVEPVLSRAIDYWRKVDGDLGARVAKEVSGG